MLTHEENEALCRVGAGTPMGELMREYWLPALLSSELPEAGGAPVRVRLLGESLVAFRSTDHDVGLLAENCPHRQASLFFGRNEDCGLRCIYHGWKFDTSGQCVDMPNERPESAFAAKVRTTSYPCRERGGVVWTYMGPRAEPPPLPDLEWNMVPEDRVLITQVLRECNWLQTLEGDIDSSHVNFLHRDLFDGANQGGKTEYWSADGAPRMEALDTDYGTMVGARRQATDDSWFYRISLFLFPFHTYVAPVFPWSIPGHVWVPMDDENTMTYNLFWNPHEAIGDDYRRMLALPEGPYVPHGDGSLERWLPVANRRNDYLVDREAQRTTSFSGIGNVNIQDRAMAESMGPVVDRTKERLGTADSMILKTRRRLLGAALAFRDEGTPPPGVDEPHLYRVRSACLVVPKDEPWVDAAQEWMEAFSTHEVAFI